MPTQTICLFDILPHPSCTVSTILARPDGYTVEVKGTVSIWGDPGWN